MQEGSMNNGDRRFRHTKEEMHRLGQHWFETRIEPLVADRDKWDAVAIDVDSGDFEVDHDPLTATERLLARRPDAEIWARRVGFPFQDRFGPLPKRRPVILRRLSP
jgi:hypothetical protein